MAVTIKEIAAMANVSRGTVDRVLNNRGKVSLDVEQRVKKIAEQYGYHPNKVASALKRSSKPFQVGLVISSRENEFYADILKGIKFAESEFSGYGFEFNMIEIKDYNPEEMVAAIKKIMRQKIDALILTPVNSKEVIDAVNECNSKNIKVVFLNTSIEAAHIAYVGCDYYKSGQTVAGLVNLANRTEEKNVVIIKGMDNIKSHDMRVQGFSDVLNDNMHIVSVVENKFSNEQSYKIVKELLEEKQVDIIYSAVGCVKGTAKAITESGKECQLYMMDYTESAKELLQSGIAVATVTQQPFEQGYYAVKLLYNNLVCRMKVEDKYTELNIVMKNNMT